MNIYAKLISEQLRLPETGVENTIALLAAKSGDTAIFVFGAAPGCPLNMGRLLSESVKPLGGKGGGRPDFAQGGGPLAALDRAKAAALVQLRGE